MRISDWSSDVCSSDLRFGRDNAFMARLMGQPGRAGDVADRPDAVHICAAIGIGVDMALGGFHAQGLQTDVFGVGRDADGDDCLAELLVHDLPVRPLYRGLAPVSRPFPLLAAPPPPARP